MPPAERPTPEPAAGASDAGTFAIGDVAAETGITPDTLRMWERRYGRPRPVRLPSGHRRYSADQLHWLRTVAEALALGVRPRQAVTAGDDELRELLVRRRTVDPRTPEVERLLEHVRGYRGAELARRLRADHDALGTLAFLEERVAPLLVAVGRGWAEGELDVRHEHFASETIGDLLRGLRATGPTPAGPTVVLATLAGELHELGLQMAALVCQRAGLEPRVLGADTPERELVDAALELDAAAVALSVSLSSGGVETDRRIGDVRRALPSGVRLVVGGSGARGARRGPRGVEYVGPLSELAQWAESLARSPRRGGAA